MKELLNKINKDHAHGFIIGVILMWMVGIGTYLQLNKDFVVLYEGGYHNVGQLLNAEIKTEIIVKDKNDNVVYKGWPSDFANNLEQTNKQLHYTYFPYEKVVRMDTYLIIKGSLGSKKVLVAEKQYESTSKKRWKLLELSTELMDRDKKHKKDVEFYLNHVER